VPWGLGGIARGKNNKLAKVFFLTFDCGIVTRLQTIFITFVCEIASPQNRNNTDNKNGCIKSGTISTRCTKCIKFNTVWIVWGVHGISTGKRE